ncbi:replication protein [Acinetobacter sp. C_4_1]|uniref:replication protein n=1 Tax=unclassified Acinetobacter TaxID=196816 RepID=UPI0021B75CE5|nr:MULTISPECIES: replication protein [unclassified Acinetobacter]MCT8090695.1 replication protein [Acinetobacter sp. F_3_1]MCT8101573.1 replication protein [Acinetobacter sp. C_4_1]MCT8135092.1 replication protein [Acinetobacter sp. T_3_1]
MSQWIPNSFQMPNALVDSGMLAKLKGSSLAMYIFIVRKTRGWQKESDSISLSQFIEFTGYGKDAVLSGADKLVDLGLIKRVEYQNQPALYTLNDLPESVTDGESEKTTAEKPHADKTTGGVGKTDSTQSENPTHNNNYKTTNTKTNISKEKSKKTSSEKPAAFDAKSVELPVNVNRDLWIQFVDMRNSIKKPLTENAVNLLIKKLIGFGECANQSLEASIIGSYQSVYPPKQQTQVQNQPQTQRRRFGNQASETHMRTVGGQTK